MTFLTQLSDILKQRNKERPEGSYTSTLFEGGLDRILRKVGEETGEVIIAAKNKDNNELKNEVADLLFHLLVLLENEDMSIEDILQVLEERHAS